MSGFEWFLLVVVVIAVPLVVAVAVTLWTLEQARQRNRKNRPLMEAGSEPVKRRAAKPESDAASGATVVSATDTRARGDRDDSSNGSGSAADVGGNSSGGADGGTND